jgi:hypothetical protein
VKLSILLADGRSDSTIEEFDNLTEDEQQVIIDANTEFDPVDYDNGR